MLLSFLLSDRPLRKKAINMQHIKRRTYTNFGNGDKDISVFEDDPADSDPGYEVEQRLI